MPPSFPRPRILVSQCLGCILCRYDGAQLSSMAVELPGQKAVDDELRLTNIILWEHFLIKHYVWTRFHSIAAAAKMGELVNFHASHKLLFLAYNQSRFRTCGKITANHEQLPAAEVFQLYEKEMAKILARPFHREAMVNTLYHAYGWIAKKLSSEEKQHIINSIEKYREERIPLQAATRFLEAQAIRFKQKYLLGQILLRPFPQELSDLSDSSNGREVQ